MDKVKNVPELRLEGFTDDWKQGQLFNYVIGVKSYSLSRNVERDENTGCKYIHYGDIHREKAKLLHSDINLPYIENGNFEPLQKGDLVLADASEDYIGIANPCVIDCFLNQKVVAGLHTIALRPQNIDSLFLYYLLHTNIFKEYGKKVGTGTKVFGITTKNVLAFEPFLPSLTEQKAIGEFFKQLDSTIDFHQRETHKLQQLKEILLKKMFV